jgi:hypothetical protein
MTSSVQAKKLIPPPHAGRMIRCNGEAHDNDRQRRRRFFQGTRRRRFFDKSLDVDDDFAASLDVDDSVDDHR